MATADDRGDLSAAAPTPPRWRFSWLGLVGIGLMLALAAAVLVQGRQFSLLRSAVQTGDDFVVLMVYQTEAEYLRLREQWRRATDERVPLDAEALRLRYEIWVSRVDLLQVERPQRLIGSSEEHRQTLAEMQRFIQRADLALGRQPTTALDHDFVATLAPELYALDADIHRLSLDASHRVAEQVEQRTRAVREQNQLGLGLTIFLSLLTLAFALIALHHLTQLRERRLVLEELATKLRQARREAEAASDAKSAFLANMSHEIRTPFHGLMGMLSLLRETGLTPRQIDYLRTATESADHLLALLNDILDMSQLEAGRMTLAPVATDLRSVLRDVEALMRPQANAKALALHFDADPGVPERLVLDATRVKQVLFNLLSNAIKFSERGAVMLDVRTREAHGGQGTGPARQMLEFVVTDSGVGMDGAALARLFQRFAQGDSSRQRRHGGTGLGLEISRNLARLMRGDITVRSKPGEGSCFTFSLPLQAVDADMRAAGDPAGVDDAAARPLQVLVAEDHPVNRQYIAALLENLGHHAHFTANGQEAVQAARERRFDVVLMDLHMPVLDGVGATKAIRALPDRAAATVPIVALTADAFEQTRDRCLMAGMNDFLTKPVSPQKLASSLRRLFGNAAGTPLPPARGDLQAPLSSPASGQPVIDNGAMEMALQAMSRVRLAQLIEAFLDQGPQTVQRLRAAVRDAEALELRVNAHAAKGAALNLGLSGLAATASALHEGASHLPAHEIARLVQRYEELLPITREAVAAAGLAADHPTGANAPI
ncbi:MAG: response regulator [Chitinophagaceae bacterium]|nr:response regulator [Rubrivivax sp.]